MLCSLSAMKLLLLLAACSANAQITRVFSFGFDGDSDTNSLSQCEDLTVGINREDTPITQPFYVFSIPVNGTPSIQAIENLSGSGQYQSGQIGINYPSGTRLILGVVDAFANFAGWSSVYTVQDGSSDACLDEVPEAALSLDLNTTSVNACGVVGLEISGGRPPYTVSTAQLDSVVNAFNITLPASDNYLSFVTDIQPGARFVFAVRDSRGAWAPTSDIVQTAGQAQTCRQQSTTSNGPPNNQEGTPVTTTANGTPTSGSDSGSSTPVGAIAGGVVGGVVGLALIALLAFCLIRRRKRQRANIAAQPRDAAYHGPPSPTLEAEDSTNNPIAPVTPFALASATESRHSRQSSSDHPSRFQAPMSEHNFSDLHVSNPDAPMPPFAANNRGSVASFGSNRGSLPAVPAGGTSVPMSEMGGTKGVLAGSSSAAGPSRVVQHEDAGAFDQPEEIPPAYISRD